MGLFKRVKHRSRVNFIHRFFIMTCRASPLLVSSLVVANLAVASGFAPAGVLVRRPAPSRRAVCAAGRLRATERLFQSHPLPASLRAGSPGAALAAGHWVKIICGASNEDVPQIRNLALIYTLAGADCIDCAADPSIVAVVDEGIRAAQRLCPDAPRPWIMVSVNDDCDPHFRKAVFDPHKCPADCPRPCVPACPARAIFSTGPAVDKHKCYGCGRCLPVCPLGLIVAENYIRSPREVVESLASSPVDALEIHTGTNPGGAEAGAMERLWHGSSEDLGQREGIREWASSLRLVAVSFPDQDLAGEEGRGLTREFLSKVSALLALDAGEGGTQLVWQTDGR